MHRRTTHILAIAAVCATSLFPFGVARGADEGALPTPTKSSDPSGLSSSVLREQVTAIEAGRTLPDQDPSTAGMLRVEVHSALPTDELTALVERTGGTIEGAVPGHLVQALVPASSAVALEAEPGIDYLSPALDVSIPQHAPGILPAAGPRLGENVTKTNADDWQQAGFRGQGVKVGIIDGFDQSAWNAALQAGEIAQAAGAVCRSNGANCNIWTTLTSVHGVAVAESITDMAPGATLYLGVAVTTADLQAVIDYMAAQGVRILSRSLAAPLDGPGDGTGPMAAMVDYAVSKGMTWVNSAGNTADGGYWRGTWRDENNNGWLEFTAAGDELLGFTCAYLMGFRWSDWMAPAQRTDYDVYVLDESGSTFLYEYEDAQQNGSPPIEAAGGNCGEPGQPVTLAVYRYAPGSGTAGDVLEFMSNGIGIEYPSADFSTGQPAADSRSPGMLSVGAINPPLGVTIWSGSGRGPTNDGRIKPDVSAASCYQNLSYASVGCFSGTSAAAPTVSGAAALVLSAFPDYTPTQVAAYLKHYAVDRGAAGPDNTYGQGEVILPVNPDWVTTPSGQSAYTSVGPIRLADTRLGFGYTVIDACTIRVGVSGVAGVPSDATAASLTITVPGAGGDGWAAIWPSGTTWSGVSTINFRAGETRANTTLVQLGAGGAVDVYTSACGTGTIIDIGGVFRSSGATSAGRLQAISSTRVLDTGTPQTVTTLTPAALGVPADATAVAVNITVDRSAAGGYVTAWGAGTPQPTASVLNTDGPGQTRAAATVVPLTSGGISLWQNIGGRVIVDVTGYFTGTSATISTSGLFEPRPPLRLVDTRPARIARNSWVALVEPLQSVVGIVANVTITDPASGGYLTVGEQPASIVTSSVNASAAGDSVANLAIVPTAGGLAIYAGDTAAATIIDVTGVFRP